MGGGDTQGSPLEATAGTTGSQVVDAFSVLGNETRLSILLALWEAYEPFAEQNAMSFSALRDAVGIRQGAQFNYHLDKLVGRFVTKNSEGYTLRRSGHELVRTVIAGAGIHDASSEPEVIDVDCGFCGAPTAVSYRDEWLFLVCTECDGAFGGRADKPEGMLSGMEFDPAGLTDRSPAERWRAGWLAGRSQVSLAIEGVCDACSGPMNASLRACRDHDSEGVCERCGRRQDVMVEFRCPICKNHHEAAPRTAVLYHPAVVAFYHQRGVNFQWDDGKIESQQRRTQMLANHEQQMSSWDPMRVIVTVRYEGESLRLTLEENLDVVEVCGPNPVDESPTES